MKEDKRKSIVVYFLEMVLVFMGLDLLMTIVAGGIASSTLFSKYGNDLIIEVFYSLIVMIVMLLFKNSYVFTDKKEKFWDGVLIAIPILVISIYNFVYSILNLGSFKVPNLINMLVFCVFIGIAEEFLCRGWLQNEFHERYSNNKKEIIVSIVLSSLVFGLMHLVNLSVQNPFETVIQIINATSLGFLLGSIYYKTRNIWSVIFLHGFYDFSIMLGQVDRIKDCTYNTPTLAISIYESFSVILISVFWILGAIYVLNKCDFDERPRKHHNNIIVIAMGFVFLIMLIPFSRLVPNHDNYKVCYRYNEIEKFDNYTLHYPSKGSYKIEYIKNDFSNEKLLLENEYNYKIYKNSEDKIVIKNVNTSHENILEYEDVLGYEVFENNKSFVIVIWTNKNESTLYVSESLVKNTMNDEDSFVDDVEFNEYAFPKLSKIGYIDNGEDFYTYALSKDNDEFVIMNGNLFVIN